MRVTLQILVLKFVSIAPRFIRQFQNCKLRWKKPNYYSGSSMWSKWQSPNSILIKSDYFGHCKQFVLWGKKQKFLLGKWIFLLIFNKRQQQNRLIYLYRCNYNLHHLTNLLSIRNPSEKVTTTKISRMFQAWFATRADGASNWISLNWTSRNERFRNFQVANKTFKYFRIISYNTKIFEILL